MRGQAKAMGEGLGGPDERGPNLQVEEVGLGACKGLNAGCEWGGGQIFKNIAGRLPENSRNRFVDRQSKKKQ